MTDALAIAAAFQSLKAAFDIGKALLQLGVSAEVSARISEMNSQILAAQESAIASRDYQFTLMKHIDDLEKQIADLEAWDAEAETYELTNMRPPNHPMGSAFAYAPKKGTHTTEPSHCICANCYQGRHKSILQHETRNPGRCKVLACHRCGGALYLEGERDGGFFSSVKIERS